MDQETPIDGRTRLVEAAMACVAEHGHHGATVRRIADKAGVTQGLIRHHFDGKDALLIEAYRHINGVALSRMQEAAEADYRDSADALDASIRAIFPEALRDPGQMRVLIAFWGLAVTNPAFAAVQHETNDAFQQFFVDLITRHFGSRADAGEIADGIIALADGLWLACCLQPRSLTPDDAIKTAIAFCRARLGEG